MLPNLKGWQNINIIGFVFQSTEISKYLQVKQFLFRFCFRFWNDATFKLLFKTLFLNTYLAVKNTPNWFKWFGKISFFLSAKIFVIEQKDCTCAIDFFYLLTHNTCLLFVFWWLFNMVWNKTCIEKDSRYLVKLTKSQKVLSIGSHLQKNTRDHSFTWWQKLRTLISCIVLKMGRK